MPLRPSLPEDPLGDIRVRSLTHFLKIHEYPRRVKREKRDERYEYRRGDVPERGRGVWEAEYAGAEDRNDAVLNGFEYACQCRREVRAVCKRDTHNRGHSRRSRGGTATSTAGALLM